MLRSLAQNMQYEKSVNSQRGREGKRGASGMTRREDQEPFAAEPSARRDAANARALRGELPLSASLVAREDPFLAAVWLTMGAPTSQASGHWAVLPSSLTIPKVPSRTDPLLRSGVRCWEESDLRSH